MSRIYKKFWENKSPTFLDTARAILKMCPTIQYTGPFIPGTHWIGGWAGPKPIWIW
jgi:hypothetical protein